MTVLRLTKVVEVVRLWPYFSDGVRQVSDYLRYTIPLDVYRKILFRLVRTPFSSWVGVALDDLGEGVGFLVAHEVTPLFSTTREFEVSLFYHTPGQGIALSQLQQAFDTFCKANRIRRYYVTTVRKSGSAGRVFGEEWYGLKRAYTVFKRTLN